MTRGSGTKVQKDGSISIRVSFPSELWEWISLAGKLEVEAMNIQDAYAKNVGVFMFMRELQQLYADGDLIARFRNPQFAIAYTKLRDEINAKADAVERSEHNVDPSWLHMDTSRKYGYYGVFTRGPGFEARVRPDNGLGWHRIGPFKTAELAAIARFEYYVRHPRLAYGQAEEEVVNMRKMDPTVAHLDDVMIWPHVLDHLKNINRLSLVFGAGCVSLVPGPREPQLAARKASNVGELPSHEEIHAALAAPVVTEPTVRGFEDGDLPACFNDDWKPEDDETIATQDRNAANDLYPEYPETKEPEPRKRGRPRKPCFRCGLTLKALGGEGPKRYHVDDEGRRVNCIGRISFVA